MKFRASLLAVCCAVAVAQTGAPDPQSPPPELEKTLKARAHEFYSLILKHEYRRAEEFVADDTKEFYYDGSKPQISKFEVQSVKFSDNFTKAVVTTLVTQRVMMATNDGGNWTLPIPSAWRLENGSWYWYVDQSNILNPVGRTTAMGDKKDGDAPVDTSHPVVAGVPKEIPKTPDFALGKVAPEQKEITLAPGETGKVAIVNGSQGQVRLMLLGRVAGVEAKLDRAQVNAGQKAVLNLEAGKDAAPGVFYVQVIPTAESFTIEVKIK